jgi:ubiquinone/menaquinone biosynthesis C-methylase UbiE
MSIENKRQEEKKIYEKLYNQHGSYGGDMHSKNALDKILSMGIKSLVDVGCGRGQFPNWAKRNGIEVVHGVDFAAKFDKVEEGVELHRGYAHDLTFLGDDSVEYVTAFDVLEHLIPEDTETVLDEFNRVATRGFIFSIAYEPSKILVEGRNLHPNVKSEEWWVDFLGKYGTVEKYKEYIFVKKGE